MLLSFIADVARKRPASDVFQLTPLPRNSHRTEQLQPFLLQFVHRRCHAEATSFRRFQLPLPLRISRNTKQLHGFSLKSPTADVTKNRPASDVSINSSIAEFARTQQFQMFLAQCSVLCVAPYGSVRNSARTPLLVLICFLHRRFHRTTSPQPLLLNSFIADVTRKRPTLDVFQLTPPS